MTAIEFAKRQGFSGARAITSWNGKSCYEAVLDGAIDSVDAIPNVGFPQIIIQEGATFRMASYDEAMSYMDFVVIGEG